MSWIATCVMMSLCLLLAAPRAAPQVLYVDADAGGANTGASWADAYTDLQSALDVATGGETIRIAGGTYTPSVLTVPGLAFSAAFHLLVPLTLRGGYAGAGAADPDARDLVAWPTFLSGEIGNPLLESDNAVNIVLIQPTASGTTIDGCSIVEGQAGWYSLNFSGGALKAQDADLRLVDCTIAHNSSINGPVAIDVTGGTVELEDCLVAYNQHSVGSAGGPTNSFYHADVVLERCRFEDNGGSFGGGAFSHIGGSLRATDCTFTANLGLFNGGALYLGSEEFTAVRCTFIANEAVDYYGDKHGEGGAISAGGVAMRLQNCRFIGNHAHGAPPEPGEGGALLLSGGTAMLENCLFSGNVAFPVGTAFPPALGGAIRTQNGAQLALVGCTLAYNRAEDGGGPFEQGQGGGIYGSATLADCILWGNTDPSGGGEAAQLTGGAFLVNYSCVQGLTGALGGAGNIGMDPLFVNAFGADGHVGTQDDDLHPRPGSPCADAASTPALPLDTLDLDGDGVTAEKLPFDLDDTLRLADDIAVADTGLGPSPNADMGAYERSAWTNLGHALAGTNGTAFHFGFGTLQAGTLVALGVNHGIPGGVVYLCIGPAAANAPFKGGIMVPDLAPPGFASAQVFNGLGNLVLAGLWPAGIPSGATIVSQCWFADPGAPQGFAASNAVSGTTP